MTNEEAVRILRRIQEPEAWEPKVNEAAFEALGRQQAAGSEELIGKQTAITALTFAKETGTMKCGELKGVIEVLNRLPSAEPEIVYCKDCKHFEFNHVENVNGIPLIVAHEICMRWSDGVKTSENGYCFLGERRERQHEQVD